MRRVITIDIETLPAEDGVVAGLQGEAKQSEEI